MTLERHRWLNFTKSITLEKEYSPQADEIDYLFKVADSACELLESYHLLYHEYVQAGYTKENKNEILVTKHHLLPKTTVLLAKSENTVISTATLVPDSSQFGLPMDDLFGKELASLRRQRRKVVEVCSLASNTQRFSRIGIHNFTRLLFLYCVFQDVDDVCVMVNPKHVPIYKRLCDLEIFGDEKHYHRVNAPAVALRANVATVRDRLGESGLMASYRNTLNSHYLSLRIALCDRITGIFKDLDFPRFRLAPLDTSLINHILSDVMDDVKDLSLECKILLRNSYPGLQI
ncbi:MAG: hypothetical protein CVU60_07890 [Deltaproteobacteria bacterium HGW-Deltaproteobacteria-18]|jgi:hypothetical protein|nr:MAG: hypothetical protein CVU60_07890 [Deltaproteobacteria bacterium HGW-Deltaproteobacteria-18]